MNYFADPTHALHVERIASALTLGQLHAALSCIGDGIIISDQNGRIQFFNSAAERILGTDLGRLIGREWTSECGLFEIDETTPLTSGRLPLARAIQGEHVVEELVFVRSSKWATGLRIRVSAGPITGEGHLFSGGWLVFRDVTESQSTRDELRRLSRVVDQTADSVVITDRKGVIEYVNPAFETTTGYNCDEAIGRTPRILKSGKHDLAFHTQLWDTITSGDTWRGTIVNKKKNGEHYWSQQTISPMKDEDGSITNYVSVLKDMTDFNKRKEQEHEIAIARQVQQFYYNAEISIPGFDIAGAATPADQTGGDYYDFVSMPGGCFGIVVGDVAGHGLGAALVLAETRAFLRAFAAVDSDPATILARLNHELYTDLQDDMFVTAILARIDPLSRSLVYASAGHVTAHLINGSGDVEFEMGGTGAPLGILQNLKIENSRPVELAPGNIAAFTTDGVMEAEAPDGTQFGLDRTLDFIRSHRQCTAVQIIRSLHEEVRLFCGDRPQKDDITTVICRVDPID
jgi:sigma-B regulation protein RsbU (phosphoserine phosphatase)